MDSVFIFDIFLGFSYSGSRSVDFAVEVRTEAVVQKQTAGIYFPF